MNRRGFIGALLGLPLAPSALGIANAMGRPVYSTWTSRITWTEQEEKLHLDCQQLTYQFKE